MVARDEQVVQHFLTHQLMVRDFVLGLLRDADAADDVFQEVALAILRKDEMPVAPADFPKWCRGIAKNKVLQYWGKKSNSLVRADARMMEAIESAYERATESPYENNTRRKQALARCMKKLKEPDREILDLRYVKGQASGEIGLSVRLAAQTVRRRLMSIRDALRRCVHRQLHLEAHP